MKVLIADPFETSGLEGLTAAGCEVVFDPALKDDELATALRDTRAEVLIVRSTKVTAAMMDAGGLALIVRAGAGYNTIDVAAASARGIYVSNCPGKNATAVAELAFGLILALDRRIPDNVAELRAGRWNKKEFSKAKGLHGRTLGLLGFGNIAQELARRAQAFGMDIAVCPADSKPTPRRTLISGATVSTPPTGTPASASSRRRARSLRWPTSSVSTSRLAPRPAVLSAQSSWARSSRAPSSSTRPAPRSSTITRWQTRSAIRDYASVSMSIRTSRPTGRASTRSRYSPCPASTARITSAPRPSRPRRRSLPRRSGSSARSRRRARSRTASTSPVGHRQRTCWSFVTTTDPASWPMCSSTCASRGSMSSRPRTSSSRMPAPLLPGSTWMVLRPNHESPTSLPAMSTS